MRLRKHRTNRRAALCAGVLEPLEARSLFSAPYEFATVGMRFDAGNPGVFEMLGQLGADGAVTGSQSLAFLTGGEQVGPIDWASLQSLSGGGLLTAPRSGVDPYASQVGGQFIWENGFGIGSLLGLFGEGGPTDVAFTVQRAEGRNIQWTASGRYEFQYIEIDAGGYSIRAGSFYVSDADTVVWSDRVDGQGTFEVGVDSQDEFGSLTLADGRALHAAPNIYATEYFPERVYPPGMSVLIVDTDASDGKIGIGIARRFRDDTIFGDSSYFPATYRATILTNGALGASFFHSETTADGIGIAAVAIELDFSGGYRIYDQVAFDTGERTVLSSGTWVASDEYVGNRRSFVVLTDAVSGDRATLLGSFDFTLHAFAVESADGQSREGLVGSASAFAANHEYTRGGHVGLDDDGHPIFYYTAVTNPSEPSESQDWYSQDLLANWGGKPLVMVDSVQVRSDNAIVMVVGVAQDGDVLVWDRQYNGRWFFRNLTQELGAPGLVSDLTIFDYRDSIGSLPTLAIAGKSADGDLVLYTPALLYDDYGSYPWSAVNITDDLQTPFGETTPVWTGAVQGYQTTWGGLNVIGIDAAGDLVVAWTAPGLSQWITTNLSEVSNTPSVAGAISVLMTRWSGIHIHALDEQGALHVTWWVPQFQGTWAHNVLTDDAAGPLFDTARNTARSEAFTTFIGVGNTLNIVGFDAAGRVRVYWWSPATNIWLVGDITNSFPVSEAPEGFAASDFLGGTDLDGPYSQYGQSLYGYNDDGSLSRVWWASGGPDRWHVENLTELAIPVVI